jgi:DNA-binding CsgD family transcriptional regulator
VFAEEAAERATRLGDFVQLWAYAPLAQAALAAGDLAAAAEAGDAAVRMTMEHPELTKANVTPMAELALARRDLTAAKRLADEVVAATSGWHRTKALITRAHVVIAQGDVDQAERDGHETLACACEVEAYQYVPDALEVLGVVATSTENHRDAARFFGAGAAIRQRQGGSVRLAIYDAEYTASLAEARNALGESDFEAAWAEGAALSLEEAIAYAQRGHGERKRPSTGWESLTPTELDVVKLVSGGLGNKDIAARLFISHRTVQTHLTHVYAKLGITSRVQLAQEAGRRG